MGENMNKEKRICLNRSVLDFMDKELPPESIVLELGSGWSSLWFAERCGELFTVETHPVWVTNVENELKGAGLKNWQMIKCCLDIRKYPGTVERSYPYPSGSVDVALVDCREDFRAVATDVAWYLLKPGGWLVFDDAQRPRHQISINVLIQKAGTPTRLEWHPGDIESAKERLALAWKKPEIKKGGHNPP